MEITTSMIKELRDATSAGVLDCREALDETGGDSEKAIAYLREKGHSEAAKKSEAAASEGRIEAYVHHGSQVGVMLELNCETDFVARTDDFANLAHNLALHIAFSAPRYFTREGVPEEVIDEEKRIYRKQALEEGKPEDIVERIVEGRMEKFYQQVCLLEQPFVKNEDKTIKDLLNEATMAFGELVVLSRFERYEVGE
ncbi:MAG: translation elongation factor Ts [Chloroflexota bacterium]|nr:translation elongation factor Ts [Chloroflexota bacterium]